MVRYAMRPATSRPGLQQIDTISVNPVRARVPERVYRRSLLPIFFSATLIGPAANLLLPFLPVSIGVLCIETSALALAMGAPLTAILLVADEGPAPHHIRRHGDNPGRGDQEEESGADGVNAGAVLPPCPPGEVNLPAVRSMTLCTCRISATDD